MLLALGLTGLGFRDYKIQGSQFQALSPALGAAAYNTSHVQKLERWEGTFAMRVALEF